MATITRTSRTATGGPPDVGQERKTKPVKVWATVGAFFILLQGYVFISWLLSGPTPAPAGPSAVPTWQMVTVRTAECIGVVLLVLAVWFWLIKPWRRAGHITFKGLMLLAFTTMWWQDGLASYSGWWFTYNAKFVNLGSWYGHVPGWLAPNAENFVQPLVWTGPMYPSAWYGAAILVTWVMRRAKARWPQMGKFGMVMVAIGFGFVFDLILEPLVVVRSGLWSYPGAIKSMTLWHGEYYQFPIYEAVLAGFWFGGMGALRYFRNDKGHTVAERGADELRVKPGTRTFVRFLALAGIMNVIGIVAYQLPSQWFGTHADPWPKVFTEDRTYLSDMLCGPHTTYACPGPGIPLPRPDSARVGPNGQLVPGGVD